MMGIPEYWRSPDNQVYRVRRGYQELFEQRGARYSVRLEKLGDPADRPVAESSVELREADLLQTVRLGHQAPTPEQLYQQAFDQAVGSVGRTSGGSVES